MVVEASLKSKTLYKLEIIILKFIPFIIAISYFINTLFSMMGIDIPLISYLTGVSLIPFIFLLLSSFVFKFCSWHRIPLYYILINDVLNILDSKFLIPLEDREYLELHLILFFMCFITVFVLRKKCSRND